MMHLQTYVKGALEEQIERRVKELGLSRAEILRQALIEHFGLDGPRKGGTA